MNRDISNKRVQIMRWVARVWGVISLLFIGTLVFAELLNPSSGPPQGMEWVMLALFPTGVLLGIVLGWRWELWGGIISVASFLAFYAIEFAMSGDLADGPFFLLVAAPGFLFLWCGIVNKRSTQPLPLDA